MSTTKRPTRFKVEFVDATGEEIWDALVTQYPPWEIRRILDAAGIKARRTTPSKGRSKAAENMIYSELDPIASIEAAQEFMARRETMLGNVLKLFLARRNLWVTRDEIREVGGDSGDRRVRELRDVGWPIETSQEKKRSAWSCRLVLPSSAPWDETLF